MCSPHTRGSVGAGRRRMTASTRAPRTRGGQSARQSGAPRIRRESCTRRHGAPRTRGGQSLRSPHTRGVDAAPLTSCAVVLPAHAGVSRRGRCRIRSCRWCSPHTRGSVGGRLGRSASLRECSPHTRGSVDEVRRRRRLRAGAPRTRGGQSAQRWEQAEEKGAPRTRGGQSIPGTGGRGPWRVLPAHAGVSRTGKLTQHRTDDPCSPHTRGSVERHAGRHCGQRSCSPHTRGSVELPPDHVQRTCSPHTRGSVDPARPYAMLMTCSPHTRGSVSPATVPRRGRSVLPAHAGVSRTAAVSARCRHPVLPAHAGVSRMQPRAAFAVELWPCSPHTRGSVDPEATIRRNAGSAPRTRGGQSTAMQQMIDGRKCSPHTRGSVGLLSASM